MKLLKQYRGLWLLLLLLGATTLACGGNDPSEPDVVDIPRGANVVDVTVNAGASDWLAEAANEFNRQEIEVNGDPVYVRVAVAEAGQMISQFTDGEADSLPDMWIPDSNVWVNVAADAGTNLYQDDCTSLAESPLVIAMWQEIAELLGWPNRELGWLDVGSLAADPSAWVYYSGGQYGDSLRLGHTHPGLSATGTSTLLALVQAAQSKSEAVGVDEIQQPIVQASVGAFEGAVSWFSSDTASLGATMSERGAGFLGAAVMYESTVINHNTYNSSNPIVPIYPFEGTFMATHPACVNSTASGDNQDGVRAFRDFLLGTEMQQLAVSDHGLRPVNEEVDLSTSMNGEFGVDFAQPTTIFASPTVATIYAAQDVWQSARKDVNLVMLLDVSGSMNSGSKIGSMRQAAVRFVEQMGDDDYLTLISFSHELTLITDHERVGDSRDKITNAIMNLTAAGDTALYEAIGIGSEQIARTTSPNTTNALVVLTDGQNTVSPVRADGSIGYQLNDALFVAAAANNTTVFTIAYGTDANEDVLQRLAAETFGNYYQGSEADIAGIYQEMSAAFGGSLGIGR